jgi:cytochrome c oxidase subunit 4
MSSLAQSNEIPAPVADDVASDGHHPAGAHAVPKRVLLGVFGLLCVLTAITVGVSYIDLGPANIWIALFVAVIKGSLVVMYFMHLRWDSPFNGVILIAAMFFVALFIGIAMLDSKEYQPNLQAPEMIQQFTTASAGDAASGTPSGALLPPDQVTAILKSDSSASEPRIHTLKYEDIVATAEKDPGDPKLGMALFQDRGCITCHTTSKDQAPRAPYLGDVTIRHTDPGYIFESILHPSAKIAEGFATNLFVLKDKTTVLQGFVIAEDDESFKIRDTNGVVTTIPKSMIYKHRQPPLSIMPEGLADNLTVHDLASIYAFLDSLNKTTLAEK